MVEDEDDDDDPLDVRRERRARKARRRRAFGIGILRTFAIVLGMLMFIIFVVSGTFVHFTAKSALEDELDRRLESVASLVAREIQGEPNDRNAASLMQTIKDPEGKNWARNRTADLCRRAKIASGVRNVVVFQPWAELGTTRVNGAGQPDAPRSLVRVLATADTPRDASASDAVPGDTAVEVADTLLSHKTTIERVIAERTPSCTPLYFHAARGDSPAERAVAGRYYKSAYAPVNLKDDVVLLVGVDIPTDFPEALEGVDNQFLLLGAGSFLAVLASAVLLVRQRVQVPIYRLVRAMEGGEDATEPGPPIRARVRWRDEIGALTDQYNRMVDRLEAQEAELRELYDEAKKHAEFLTGYSKYLVEGVPTAVVAVAPDTSITVWNAAAQRILGKGLEALAQPLTKVLEPEHPVARALLAGLKGDVSDQAFVGLGPLGDAEAGEGDQDDAGSRLVELAAGPFKNPETGAILGAAALVHDRTELERLRRAAARNERLAAVGRLAAGLAHEIRNPLGAISGFAELIERKKGEGDATRLATRLRGEVDELNRFVTEFLSFARDQKIKRAPCDLNELLRRSTETALQAVGYSADETKRLVDGREAVVRNGAELRVTFEEDPLLRQASVDATALRAALVNVAKNAVEAMQGRGTLGLRARLSGDRAVLRIRDTGPGVPPELREKIFDPFFTTRDSGTGLGLAIAHKVVVAHGGKIAVRAPDEGGCEFVIRVPISAEAASSAGPPAVEDDATPLEGTNKRDVLALGLPQARKADAPGGGS